MTTRRPVAAASILYGIVFSWAAAWFHAQPVAAQMHVKDRFIVLQYDSLERDSMSWDLETAEALDHFVQHCTASGEILKYLIIPTSMVDRSSPGDATAQTWGLFEIQENSADQPLQYLRAVNPPSQLLDAVDHVVTSGRVEGSPTGDAVILEDRDLNDLIRLSWFNRGYSAQSAEIKGIKEFDDEFLKHIARKWFFESSGSDRLLIVTGLRTDPVATAYAYIPQNDDGGMSFFRIYSGERGRLKATVDLLNSRAMPVSVRIDLAPLDFKLNADELNRISKSLEIKLSGGSEFPQHFTEVFNSKDSLLFVSDVPREALGSPRLNFSFDKSSPYRFLDREAMVRTAEISRNLHSVDGMLGDENGSVFSFTISKQIPSDRVQSKGTWHHEVTLEDVNFPLSIDEILKRYKNWSLHAGNSIQAQDADDEGIMGDAEAWLDAIGSQGGRAIMSLSPDRQREFVSELSQLNRSLESLWSTIRSSLWLSRDHLEIVIVKHRSTSLASLRLQAIADRRNQYVLRFLEHKLKSLGELGQKVKIIESEQPESDEHKLRKVECLLVPLSTSDTGSQTGD
ncbi:MAG: hypothetical protein ABUT39_11565 [Acidobacteriota bacterium]